MLTGAVRSQIDRIWDAFWSGGISNPLEVIEQITYLLFLRRLDDLYTLEESKALRFKKPRERRIFPEGKDDIGKGGGLAYEEMRWSRFQHLGAADMYKVVGEHVFPFLRQLGGDESTYAHHMKDARFTIPTPSLLEKVVDLIAEVPMQDRDTKGDLYEYMLGKIASAGQNGQFRTPRHIIRLMVEMTAPVPTDLVCDPALGTAGFLVAVGEYLREHHPNLLRDAKLREHLHHRMFHGYDFDNTMLRIGSMNMLLHGVENPDIRYRDSLALAQSVQGSGAGGGGESFAEGDLGRAGEAGGGDSAGDEGAWGDAQMKAANAWPRVSLDEAFWFQEGPGVRNWQFTASGIKLLNVANIEKGPTLNLAKTTRHLDVAEVEERYTHFLVDAGDLVIASSGISFDYDGLLRTRGAFVESRDLPLCLNTSTIRFKAVEGTSDLNFLRHWLNSWEFRSQITKLVPKQARYEQSGA